MAFMPSGQMHRDHQRLAASYLTRRMSETYTVVQDLECKQLVFDMLTDNNYGQHFRRYSASLMFCLCYSTRLPVGNEREVCTSIYHVSQTSTSDIDGVGPVSVMVKR